MVSYVLVVIIVSVKHEDLLFVLTVHCMDMEIDNYPKTNINLVKITLK